MNEDQKYEFQGKLLIPKELVKEPIQMGFVAPEKPEQGVRRDENSIGTSNG